jgi:isoquinoline 1-oxidoreductase
VAERVSRRELLELLGAGVTVPWVVDAAGQPVAARLHMAADGAVTLLTGKVEIGQGCRTLLTQCVAEELEVDPSRVRVIMGDTALVPDDGGTYASLTTPLTVPLVRTAAAAQRRGALMPPERWKVLGTPLKNVNGRAIVTGRLEYASDLELPGMLAAKMVRPAAYDAQLRSYDAAAAERLPGVKVVRAGNLLGVIAGDELTAEKAAALVKAEWEPKDLPAVSELPAYFKKTSVPPVANFNTRYPPLLEKGSVSDALANAAIPHEAAYTVAPIAHAPMEPRSAIATWEEDRLTVHCGTQVPFATRAQLAKTFGIPENQVRVIVSDTGSGFGGKHGPEVMLEAAHLAKAAGKAVRVAWTREEEFVFSYCRPAGLVEVRSGLSSGKIAAWEFRNYNSGAASLGTPYSIPNYVCAFHRAESPLRQGPYRSLAAVANTFARETHVEELAALAEADPVEFRLRNIGNPRTREAITRAAERFGWGKSKAAAGMACNLEKDAHLALFVEVESAKQPRVVRAVMAFDPGAVLNPDNLRNQITGAIIMGIGGALFEELRFSRQSVLNNRFSAYRVPRFSDTPRIDVILVDRREVTPAGAGESPITVVAPAIAAALFRATGKRLRDLPLMKGLA